MVETKLGTLIIGPTLRTVVEFSLGTMVETVFWTILGIIFCISDNLLGNSLRTVVEYVVGIVVWMISWGRQT